jgi:uncharacterized protein involved in response to NO
LLCAKHDRHSAISFIFRPGDLVGWFSTLFSRGFDLGGRAIPLWLGAYAEGLVLPTKLAPLIWHAHEMVFGYAAATVAGFLLTAIPNWTGRMPLQGGPLAAVVLLWVIGRLGVLLSGEIGAPAAAVADLCFPAVFLAVVAREILAGKNWRNLPMLGACRCFCWAICSSISTPSISPIPANSATASGSSPCSC